MAEAEHPKGTPQNPLTRDDVLRLRDEFLARLQNDADVPGVLAFRGMVFQKGIVLQWEAFSGQVEVNGQTRTWDTAFSEANLQGANLWEANLQGADLGWANLQGANLRGANLQGANLRGANLQGANLVGANLQGANLVGANLQGTDLDGANLHGANLWEANLQGADLDGANLQGANLWEANLQGADLDGANLQGADLFECQWQEARHWETVRWGNYWLGQEKAGHYEQGSLIYRELKAWHTQRGIYDRAGEFFYREMECKRKGTSFRQNPGQWLWLNLLWGPLGYGEKPGRVVGYGLLVWLLFATAYFAAGVFWGLVTPDFFFALYLSAVSFTALGYGPWIAASAAQGWVQGLAAFESFVGVFMIAVFVTTFVRKMTR